MAETAVDVLFIGAGPGGYVGAIRAAQNGLKTAVVEKEERPGGTCLLRGCIPTKSLLESASLYESVQDAAEFGILAREVGFDWGGVNKRKDKAVTKNANGVKFLFRKNGIEHIVGTATFTGPGVVEVSGPAGAARRIVRAKHVVLATGSAPRHIPIAKVDAQRIFTSDEFLEIKQVPKSLIVVGAGTVGVEFASVCQRFGSTVTIVEMLPRLVPIEDAEISAELERCFRRRNVAMLTSTTMKEVRTVADGVEVLVETKGETKTLRAEALLIAVGRRPVSEGLGLEKFKGVQIDRGFVKVSRLLETGEPWLSGIGDVVSVPDHGHPQLAHLASAEGVLVGDRLAGKHVEPLNYDQVISATYSEPEVASVGFTEERARELYGKIKVGKFPYAAIGKAAVVGHTDGFIKIIATEKHDELVGMHIIGAKATELIHEGAVAMRLEGTSEELWRTIHAHPTLSEGVMEAAHAVEGKAIGA